MASAKTLVVTIPGMIGESDLAPLREVSDVTYDERESIDQDELAALCEGYDYLMLNYDVLPTIGNFKLSDEFYEAEAVQSLKAVATDITGMDWASPKAAAKNDVTLLNIPHYSTQSVAESTLSEVLLHSRQRHRAYMDQLRGETPKDRKGINLADRTAGIVGLGSIGERASGLLSALGMNVIAWNRSERPGTALVPLEELFDRSDVICICLKTVKEGDSPNTGIVGRDLLSRCKGAIIINLANEVLVDHEAMADAIEAGNVSGYSVEWSDDLRSSRLGQLEAVHFPPHNAWSSDESLETLRETWVANVVSAIHGSPVNVYAE